MRFAETLLQSSNLTMPEFHLIFNDLPRVQQIWASHTGVGYTDSSRPNASDLTALALASLPNTKRQEQASSFCLPYR
jgi:hypothetical protein